MSEKLGRSVLELDTDDTKLKRGLREGERGARKLDRDFERTARNIAANFERVGRQMQAIGDRARQVGNTLTRRVTAPILAMGTAVALTGANFEKEMNAVRAISGATGRDLERLEEQARLLGSTTQFSAGQAAQGMQFLSMAGFEVNQTLEAMPGVLNLAAAGQIDLAESADIASNILTGFRLEADQTGRMVDVLAAVSTNANTNIQQMGEAMKFVAPVAAVAGQSVEEASAAIGFLSDAGIQGGMAGTTLRRALAELLNPASRVNEAMEEAGVSAFDASGNLLPLADILDNISEAGIPATQMMELFGQRAGPGMSVLLSQGGEALREFTGELEESTGTAARIAEQRMEGLLGTLTNLRSALEGLAISISNSGLLEFLTAMAERLVGLVRWMSELPGPVLKVITVVAGLAAAVGPLLIVFGLLASGIGAGMVAMAGLVTVVTPFIPVFLKLLAAVRVGVGLWNRFGAGLTSVARPALQAITQAVQGLAAGLFEFMGVLPEIWQSVVNVTSNAAAEIVGFIRAPAEAVWGVAENIVDAWQGAMRLSLRVVASGVSGIAGVLNRIPGVDIDTAALQETITDIPNMLGRQAESMGEVARGMGESVVRRFQEGQRAAMAEADEAGEAPEIGPNPDQVAERYQQTEQIVQAGQLAIHESQAEAQREGLGVDEDGNERTPLDLIAPRPEALAKRMEELEEGSREGWSTMSNLAGDFARETEQMNRQNWSAQETTMSGALGSMLSSLSSHSKSAFRMQKAAGIANAIVSTYQGIAAALELGWPMGPIAAAAIGAQGFAAVSSIRSASFSGGGSTSIPSAGSVSTASASSVGEAPTGGQGDEGIPRTVTVRGVSDRTMFRREEVQDMMNGMSKEVARGNRPPQFVFED
jgi:TP901 family phage tail tape measure protein